MGEDREKAFERPLILPDEVKEQAKEYWDNAARGFFPKPKQICLEDIEAACARYNISFQASAGTFWFIFPSTAGLAEDGQNRCLEASANNPDGRER